VTDARRGRTHTFSWVKAIVSCALVSLAGTAHAATFVYVSNAEDGSIGMYTLGPDGALQVGPRVEAGKVVMPMSVSPDQRFLYAAVRSTPYTVLTYSRAPRPRNSRAASASIPRAATWW
jgi:6-phosphogluconolactonase